MEEKSKYEVLNKQMYTIIKEALEQSKLKGDTPEVAYKDSKKGIELLHYVIEGINLYYDSKTTEAYVSREELFEKGKNKKKVGVVYLHRPYAPDIKRILPYYEISCLDPLKEGNKAFSLSCYSKGFKNSRFLERATRVLPTTSQRDEQGRIPLSDAKKKWKSDMYLKLEDLLSKAIEATPAEDTKLKETYSSAIELLEKVHEISDPMREYKEAMRKIREARRTSRYQGSGPDTRDDGER